MTDSIFARVQRVLSSGVESATEALERVCGSHLMKEAIREVERAAADIRAAQRSNTTRRLQAELHQKQARARLADLETQARYALDKGREDLAAAAVSQQLECETLLEQIKATFRETDEEAGRLEDGLAALKVRKTQMEQELAAFEAAQRVAEAGQAGSAPIARATRRAEKAEQAFERALAAVGGANDDPAAPDDAAKLAEVEKMRREERVAGRLDALKSAMAKAGPGKKRAKAG